jgi:hypothetical protein
LKNILFTAGMLAGSISGPSWFRCKISIQKQNDAKKFLSWAGFVTPPIRSVQSKSGNEREDGVANPVLQPAGSLAAKLKIQQKK